jgi:23S rRNA-/tRNA-specific pseudouridylate synthase
MLVRHEDRWLVVVEKPPGLPSQGSPDATDDLFTQVRSRWPSAALQHRLDQPASGLVLFTLHPAAHGPVTDLLRDHAIDRRYLAVLAGDAADWTSPARWDAPLDGQVATSHATRLGARRGMLAVRLQLETGRTHQLRRHAAMAGTPIAGDRRYGGDAATWAPRLALHAARLRFTHPITGATLDLRSPWPADLATLWTRAGGPDDPWADVVD